MVDLKRVVAGGPWTYDNHVLILHWIQPGEYPNLIPLNYIDIWVQVFDLPSSCMSESVGKQLGNYIGSFLEYDTSNIGKSEEVYAATCDHGCPTSIEAWKTNKNTQWGWILCFL